MATPTLDRPAPSPDYNHEKKYRGRKVVGAIALAAVGFAGYHALADRFGVSPDKVAHDTIQENLAEQKGDVYNGDPIIITPEVPAGVTVDNASPENFYKYFSQEQRVEWANEQLNQPVSDPEFVGMTVLEAKWTELASKYNLPDAPKFLGDLVAPSESMSGDQILARLTVIANVISDEPSEDKQLKLLAAYVDPANSELFNDRQTILKNGNDLARGTTGVRIDAQTNTPMESPVFTNADPGNGYMTNGIPSKIMSVGDAQGSTAQDVVRFYNGVPVLYDIYSVDDTKNVPYPERIPAN